MSNGGNGKGPGAKKLLVFTREDLKGFPENKDRVNALGPIFIELLSTKVCLA